MTDAGLVAFGIPLMARWAAPDWGRVVHQLEATISSIYAQTDPNFRIILAGTDAPELKVATDQRYEFIAVPQLDPMSRDARVMDGVFKRNRTAVRLRELGGGYLMLADADDLVSNRLVAYIRQDRHRNGYLVRDGYMFDAGRGLLAEFPFPDGRGPTRFDQECATCAAVFFSPDELPRDIHDRDNRYARITARGHPGIGVRSVAEGRPLVDFPIRLACYVRNTGQNISAEEAHAQELHRLSFQALLDDQVAAHQIERTPALEAEFNFKAAETAAVAPTLRRYHAPIGLSVLIATYRRPQGLRRLLAALRPQVEGKHDREIVVVNDGSHDARYADVVAEFAGVIRYIALDRNGGIAAARNAAVERAYGAYAVFTDDDCVPPPWWLDWLAARLRMHPEIDVLAGTTTPRWDGKGFRERVLGAWFVPRPWRLGRHDMFVTANAAIRIALLRRVGGFGFAGFDGAGEDTELALRLHRARARFAVDHRWSVAHDVDASLRSLAGKYRKYGAANATIARLTGVAMPPPPGIGAAGGRSSPLWALLRLRDRVTEANGFDGGRAKRLAAAAARAWVLSAYVAGFRARK